MNLPLHYNNEAILLLAEGQGIQEQCFCFVFLKKEEEEERRKKMTGQGRRGQRGARKERENKREIEEETNE